MITGLDPQHPWPALLSFTEDDRKFFGGRSEEETALFNAIRRDRLTILYGVSGLGKTSLLCAGVFPRLRDANFFPVLIRLDYNPGAPPLAEQVKQEIRKQTAKHGIEAPPPQPGQTLWEYFHHKQCEFWDPRARLLLPVLVFDQFEELFTKGGINSPAVSSFLDELTDLVSGVPVHNIDEAAQYHFREHAYRVVFSLREDFFPKLEALTDRFRTIFNNRVPLESMRGPSALESAMCAGGHLMSDDTARRVIYVVAGERDPSDTTPVDGAPPPAPKDFKTLVVEPALLSLFFSELNEQRLENGEEQIAPAVLNAGTRDEILSAFYDRCFEGLPVEAREFVENKLLSKDGKTRDFISYQRAVEEEKISEHAIETLIKRRLLHVEELRASRRIELSHDVLTTVVRTSRAERERKQEMERAKQARRIAEDVAKEARTSLRNARIALAVLLALFFAAIAGPLWGVFKAREGNRKQAITAYGAAQQSLDSGRSATALAYLGLSLNLDRSSGQVRAVLADLVMNRSWPVELQRFTTTQRLIGTVNADGTRVMRVEDGKVIVQEIAGPSKFPPVPLPKGGDALFNSAGNAVIVIEDAGGSEPKAAVYDAKSGRVIQPAYLFTNGTAIDVTPDLRTVIVLQDVLRLYPLPITASPDPAWLKHTRAIFDSPAYDGIESLKVSTTGLMLVAAKEAEHSLAYQDTSRTIYRIFDLVHDTEPLQLPLTEKPAYARFSTDSSTLVVATEMNVFAFDPATGELLMNAQLPADGAITASDAQRSHGAMVLVTGGDSARVWNMRSGKPEGEPLHHRRRIASVRFSADGERILTASADGSARYWDVSTGLPLGEPMPHERPLLAAVFAGPDQVIAVDSDQTIHHWSVGSASDAIVYDEPPSNLAVTADGKTAIASSDLPDVSAWDIGSRKRFARIENIFQVLAIDRANGRAVIATPDVEMSAARYKIWNPRGGGIDLDGWSQIRDAKFSGDGHVLAATSGSGALRLVNPKNGHAEDMMMIIRPDQSFGINYDGTRLMISDGDGVELYDTRGHLVGRRISLLRGLAGFDFSEDGRHLIVYTAQGGVTLYETQNGKRVAGPFDAAEHPLFATTDRGGTRLVIISERSTAVWDLKMNKIIGARFDAGDDNKRARFVGDALVLIGNGSARLWDPRTSTPLGESFACTLPPEVAGSQVYYVSGKRLLRMDAAPVAEEEIDTLIATSETIAGMSISKSGILSHFFEPQRFLKLKDKCAKAGDSSRLCRVLSTLSARLR